MPTVQLPNGQTASFPEGMSTADIQKAIESDPNSGAKPTSQIPRATIGPAPTGIVPWFNDLENDLRHGGGRTIVGRVMGHMQGQGDKGYTGLEAGVSPGVADYMGSIPLGMAKAGKGVAEIGTGHPWKGTKDVVGGNLQMATIPSAFAVGPEGAAEDVLNKVKIPSKRIAGQNLATIGREAADVPVEMGETQPALDMFRQTVKTGGLPSSTATKLANRITPSAPKISMLARDEAELNGTPTGTPAPQPINFPEARKFYTNISRETAKPGMLKRAIENPKRPNFRMDLGGVREALNTDLTNAAGQVGRAGDYAANMKEYAQGAKLNNALKKAAIGGGLYLGEEAARRSGIPGKLARTLTP